MDKDLKKCKEELDAILKKYNCKMVFNINFPQYNPNDLPATIQLAMLVISKEKIKIDPTLVKKGEDGN